MMPSVMYVRPHISICMLSLYFDSQAIVGYFEASFVGAHHTEFLKTGPRDTPTHWKQTVFYLQDPIPVHNGGCGILLSVCVYLDSLINDYFAGDIMEGSIAVARNKQDPRSLDITLSLTLSPHPETQPETKHTTYTKKYILR